MTFRDKQVRIYARGIAEALKHRPDDMTLTVHMCRGNFKSSWIAEGGYEPVADDMFQGVPVDGFFMEWDTDRAGGFEPLRFAPRDRMVVLGLVSSKLPELESKDELKRRVDEAARYLPLENLCLSPQCGFASMAVGNEVSETRPVGQARSGGGNRRGNLGRRVRGSNRAALRYAPGQNRREVSSSTSSPVSVWPWRL